MPELYDIAIIGAGPAGTSAGIRLSQEGKRVVILEREKFPRFHIGESLLPYSMTAFDRLGIRDRLNRFGMAKYGGEVATACGARAVKFYFKNGFRLQHHQAYQVERSAFDQMLVERARECGAEVREQTSVESVSWGEDRVALQIRSEAQPESQLHAKYVLDCSGRGSLIGRQLGLKMDYPHLRKFSCFAHFEGVQRDEGVDAGLTRLVRAPQWWFWLIPLDETRTSVGVVLDSATFKSWKVSPDEALARMIQESPLMCSRMAGATRVTPVHSVGDYSYRNRRLTGARWMLCGDAAGFIDPIFSTGVFLAIHSGERAAEALCAALANPRAEGARFRRYERELNRVMDTYLRFVTAWYRDEFIEVFTNPTERLQLAPAINAVLAGNIGNSFAIWWRMQVFYLVLFLQRFFPLCARVERGPTNPSNPSEAVATA